MLKKVIVSIVAAFVAVLGVSAQVVDNGTVKDNWYVSGAVGTNVWSGVNSWAPVLQANHGLRYQPLMINLAVGKYVSPYLGFEADVVGLFNTGAEHNFVDGVNYSGNIVLNASNIVCGYKANRKFTVEPIVGVGWYHIYQSGTDWGNITFRGAVRANWNVSNKWSLYVMPEYISCPEFHPFSITPHAVNSYVGATYRIPSKRGGFKLLKLYDADEVKTLNEAISTLRSELEKKVVPPSTVKTRTVVESINNSYTVLFEKGKSTVNDVTDLAKVLSKTKKHITIVGGISPEGTEEYNKQLALDRANAVKDALVNAGIDANRISVTSDYDAQRRATIVVE